MARTPNFVAATAWIPDLETEKQGYPLRLRSIEHVLDYRYSIALSKSLVDGERSTRMLVRELAGAGATGKPAVRAFDVRTNEKDPRGMAITREIKPCCERCGCTEERACVTNGQPCAWASRAPFICTACA